MASKAWAAVVEPSFFAFASLGHDRERLLGAVEQLVAWRSWLGGDAPVSVSSEAVECPRLMAADDYWQVLEEAGLAPFVPAIASCFKRAGVREFDAPTVGAAAAHLLGQLIGQDCRETLPFVLVSQTSLTPDLPDLDLLAPLSSTRDAIAIACVLSVARGATTSVLPAVISSSPTCTSVRVSTNFEDSDPDWLRDELGAPCVLVDHVKLCRTPQEWLMSLDPHSLIVGQDRRLAWPAVCVGVMRRRAERGNNPSNPISARVGPNFLSSLYSSGVLQNSATELFRAIGDTVDKQALSSIHALRKNGSGASEQVCRGQDTAWRRDIDYEYHLHYWSCSDGSVELADVVPHNVFAITS